MRECTWRRHGWAGLAALILLTHCGFSENVQEQASEATRPRPSSITRQDLITTLTFPASADARVEAAFPTQNFGRSSSLSSDLSPQMESYLRFSVSGGAGRVTRAVLRLYATDGTSDGPRVYRAGGGWTEAGLTWNNRPALSGAHLDDKGAISSGTWVEYDVTGAVSSGGEVNLALTPTSSNGTDFSSREDSRTDLRPQLVVTFESLDCMPRRERYPLSFFPVGDGYVSQGSPSRSFGGATALLVDGSPRLESYLRFSLADPGLEMESVWLELTAFDSTSNGPLLYRTDAGWTETSLTWNTRPSLIGPPLGNLGAIRAGSRVLYDLTGVVTGAGSYSFGLIPESGDGVDFYSANATGYNVRPQLTLISATPPYCSYRGAGGGLTGWVRQIGGAGYEIFRALATDAEGGFVAAGLFGDEVFPENEGLALARYAADGTHRWTRVVATDDVHVSDITLTPLGNILVVGNYEGSPDLGTGPLPPVPDNQDEPPGFFIAKFSPTGDIVWLRSFVPSSTGGGRAVLAGEVTTDAEGSVIITGGYVGTLDLGGGPLPHTGEGTPGFIAKFSWDGRHLWSRSFQTEWYFTTDIVHTSDTDTEGNILVGGLASAGSDLGAGPLGVSGPFIAKYTPSGSLLWTRVFSGAALGSQMTAVRAVDAATVAFTANLGGTFTFGGRSYTGGNPEDPSYREGGFIGTLSAAGEDEWIRSQGSVAFLQLAVGAGGTLTASGIASRAFDLGGGPLGDEQLLEWPFFVVRYSLAGSHLWSRTFDPDLILLSLASQPGGTVLLGGTSHELVDFEERTFTPSGGSDLFFLQLQP